MANTIGQSYASLYNAGLANKRTASANKNSAAEKNSLAQNVGNSNYSVEISESGLNALSQVKSDVVDDFGEKNALFDEKKLSTKAQKFLDNLREKYGDYDFIIANNVDDPQSLANQSDKGYSVILSSEEIEKMAENEEYADKVMGHVDNAVKVIDDLYEESLGEGVNFASISASIDDDGNMKLFASIEKMSAEQQERFEKLKEKRAEEKKETEAKAAEETDSEEDGEEEETETISAKLAKVEADSAEELLSKIFEIKWDDIEETEFDF